MGSVRGECQVFALILDISEVNAFLIIRYFVYRGLSWGGIPELLEFCKQLTWQIINNIHIGEREGRG